MNHLSNTQTFNPAVPSEMKTIAKVVLNGLQSPKSKRIYKMALRDFFNYWVEYGSPVPDKLFLQTYVFHMLETGVGKVSINIRLAAIKNCSREAAEMNIWLYEAPTAFARVKKIGRARALVWDLAHDGSGSKPDEYAGHYNKIWVA